MSLSTREALALNQLTQALIASASKGLRPHCSDADSCGYPSIQPTELPTLRSIRRTGYDPSTGQGSMINKADGRALRRRH
jgi:hypothetical protein